jgi:hypothetical protein
MCSAQESPGAWRLRAVRAARRPAYRQQAAKPQQTKRTKRRTKQMMQRPEQPATPLEKYGIEQFDGQRNSRRS